MNRNDPVAWLEAADMAAQVQKELPWYAFDKRREWRLTEDICKANAEILFQGGTIE